MAFYVFVGAGVWRRLFSVSGNISGKSCFQILISSDNIFLNIQGSELCSWWSLCTFLWYFLSVSVLFLSGTWSPLPSNVEFSHIADIDPYWTVLSIGNYSTSERASPIHSVFVSLQVKSRPAPLVRAPVGHPGAAQTHPASRKSGRYQDIF